MSYQSHIKTVHGKKKNNILLFALSTCPWCKKTKVLLKKLGLEYRYIDVDLLEADDAMKVYDIISQFNDRTSFPTIVINNGEDVILGFDEEAIRRLK